MKQQQFGHVYVEHFFKEVVFSEEVLIGWLLAFCAFSVILLFTSYIDLFYHTDKTASGFPCFCSYAETQSSVSLLTFFLAWSLFIFFGSR